MNEHIVRSYDDELQQLRSIVSRMGGIAESQLAGAMEALETLDVSAANTVRATDKDLDKLEMEAEKAAISMFARRAPVADDLREVVSILKMTAMLERTGDYAKNIAKRITALSAVSQDPMPAVLARMSGEARFMINRVMDAFVHRDSDLAVDVWEHDETLDTLHNEAYRQLVAHMSEMPDQIGALTHYLMIAKNIERIGDQATNLAELIFYIIEGDKLDRRPKNDITSEDPLDSL
ncbi:phosphate signaling complex protein PhoU [Yunchengibacter salinarum]|uniref:phosphate signaling complex protein PhoU n=1 Tax=Yunchengibacter salinarum TaxID=3133399 RepID=UPI0035B5D752